MLTYSSFFRLASSLNSFLIAWVLARLALLFSRVGASGSSMKFLDEGLFIS